MGVKYADMDVQPWLVVAAVLFLLGHGVVLLFLYRFRRGEGAWPASTADRDDAATVSCRECGARNDGQFRFCRECAAELPGSVTLGSDGTAPDSRGML
jgi:hypothetical protein